MLRGSVESYVTQGRREKWINNFKGLNRPIEIHVKDGVLIVPHSGSWACYFVSDEEDSVITRVRLNLLYCRAGSCPSLDSRLHADGRTDR